MSEPTSRSRNNTRKVPKLRASCDGCSVAKVRCTQTKPSCTRCSKHDVPCVYGVSRRSGKRSADSYQAMRKNAELELDMSSSASEIDIDCLDSPLHLQSTGQSTPALSAMDLDLKPFHITSNGLPSPPMGTSVDFRDSPACLDLPDSPSIESLDSSSPGPYASSPASCPELPDYVNNQLRDWAFDNMFISNLFPTPQISPQVSPKTTDSLTFFDFEKQRNLHESASAHYTFLTAPQRVDNTLQYFKPSTICPQSPASEADFMPFNSSQTNPSETILPSIETDSYLEQQQRQPKRIQTNVSNFCVTSSPKQTATSRPSTHVCQCNENIVAHLALPEFQEATKSYDMSLAQLQETLKIGSKVLNCACTSTNPSIPISLSLLAARMVSILDRLCRKAREDESNEPSQLATSGDRYSLGMYQIAKEDERRLKQEMLALQIKKTELLVLCSREIAGRVNGPMDTQAMVSEKLFSFLNDQVAEVKREWAAKNGNG